MLGRFVVLIELIGGRGESERGRAVEKRHEFLKQKVKETLNEGRSVDEGMKRDGEVAGPCGITLHQGIE